MFSHTRIKLERIGETFNIFILPKNENSDTVFLENIDYSYLILIRWLKLKEVY